MNKYMYRIVLVRANRQPSKKNAHQFEKLKPELRGVRSAIYTPPLSYPPGNGKPHLHIIKRSTNVTVSF